MGTDTSTTETSGSAPGGSTVADDIAIDVTETPADLVDQDADEELGDDAADEGSGREAAKYRRRLREAEGERDELAARVESLQRAEVERLATDGGLKPAALWASGTELASLLGEDGTVDASKVSAAVGAAREQLGIPKPAFNTKEGRSPGRPAKPSGKAAMVGAVMGRDVAGYD